MEQNLQQNEMQNYVEDDEAPSRHIAKLITAH